MRLKMRRPLTSAIAADLGSSAIQCLQLNPTGQSVQAALSEPMDSDFDTDRHVDAVATCLARVAERSAWTSRRVLVALPAEVVTMAHVEVEQGGDVDLAVASRLQDAGDDAVIRRIDVSNPWRSTRGGRSFLCIAMPRPLVIRYVETIHKLKFEIAGVYAPASMLVRAFQHVNRRAADADVATVYLHLGQQTSTIAIGHGTALRAARSIACGHTSATAPKRVVETQTAPAINSSEPSLLTTINRRTDAEAPTLPELAHERATPCANSSDLCEEIRMGIRHHQQLFDETPLQRLVFTGPGALDAAFCRSVAQEIGLPAQVGDPLARFGADTPERPSEDWACELRPQWAVAAGLAAIEHGDPPS